MSISVNAEEFKKMLEAHKAWLYRAGGKRLDLSYKKLRGLDMSGVELTEAVLTGADLSGVDLREADLTGADLAKTILVDAKFDKARLFKANLRAACLMKASLREADLSGAILRSANLREADLTGADLTGADLFTAGLIDANLAEADLECADLRKVELKGAKLENASGLPALACPETGSFTGWKFAEGLLEMDPMRSSASMPVLIELNIPASAKRSSGAGRKCRCSKAKVKRIVLVFTGEELREAVSRWCRKFKYAVGETVKVKDFDENRWNECAPGIHFFVTQLEAFRYEFGSKLGEKLYNEFKRDGKIGKHEEEEYEPF